MTAVLFDEESTWKNLLPLTFTRPVAAIRIGILTIKEKWDAYLSTDCGYHSQAYLSKKFVDREGIAIYINSALCPDKTLVAAILALTHDQALYHNNTLLAFFGTADHLKNTSAFEKIDYPHPVFEIRQVWEIFQKNGEAIKADFELLTDSRASQLLSNTVTVIGDKNLIFLEEGAKAEACILNTQSGPIYLGRDSEIMEGSVVRGPLALCEHSALKLSTKIYGPTTIGPHSKAGGEVNNSVIFGFSNKAHDGFLGNSVIGEWCNLGADTNNSNLKNNYSNVKLFSYAKNKSIDTGLQFCGMIMGDHSKAGINTMFNTGTVIGVASNIYGAGFPAAHIPGFSWGGSNGFETYLLNKLFETAAKMYERRGLQFNDVEKEILTAVFDRVQSE